MTPPPDSQRAIDILAKSVYRDLKQHGYTRADVVAFASAILEQLTNDAKSQSAAPTDSAV